MDPPELALDDIGPSPFLSEDNFDNSMDGECSFHLSIWFRGDPEKLNVGMISGGDWGRIGHAFEQPLNCFVIDDGDGERLVVRVSEVEVLYAVEFDRYTADQIETVTKISEAW
ncbi:MAG: hypothetical protein JWO94_1989 [Verrucomicrobiaceae bacterium]|nr:hypothetical protein [Verrucomicrobiaceae bacterium]